MALNLSRVFTTTLKGRLRMSLTPASCFNQHMVESNFSFDRNIQR